VQHLHGLGSGYIRDNHLQTAAWAESCAVSWGLARGYTVCTNVSGHGPADMILLKTQGKAPPQIIILDVKSAYDRSYGGLTLEQKWAGVRILKVDPDGNCTLVPKGEERIKLSRKEKKDEMDKQD
tara:strand:+ start:41 stop:415 length:375 start_codon:yes stop_codon:yes gene_type:complete